MLNIETVDQEKNQYIHQWVYQVLRANIIRLRLPPAQEISENEVSDLLGISRTPVREAFIRLAEDGLIKVTPQKRSLVALIDLEQAEEARFIRRAVEKAVMHEACRRFTPADRAALAANLKSQRACLKAKAFDKMLITDNEFHRVIYRAGGRERCWLYLKKLDYNYDRLRTMVTPHVKEQIIREHEQLLEVIESNQIACIDEVVDAHLTWKGIDAVAREYPRQYFVQDLRAGEALRAREGT